MKLQALTRRSRAPGATRVFAQDEQVCSDLADVAMYRQIFASDEVACLLIDAASNVIDVNAEFEKVTGYERSELVGKSALSLARLLTRKGPLIWLRNPLKRLGRAGDVSNEVDIYRKTGEPMTVRPRSRLLKRDGKELGRLLTVTSQRRLQMSDESENDSGDVYRSLVSHIGIGVFRTTPGVAGRFLEVNPAMEEITGYSRDELLQMDVADLYAHPEERGEVVQQVLSGVSAPRESLFRKKDGSVIVVRDRKVAVNADDGHAIYLEGFLEDVTESKRTEAALAESEEKFRTLAEQSPNMIFINKNGRIAYANERCVEVMGYSREEYHAPDFDFLHLIAPAYREAIERNLRAHSDGRDVPSYEYSLVTKDGRMVDCLLASRLVNYEGGAAILGTVTDITERKKAQEALQAQRQNYLTSMETSPLGIQIVTHEGRTLYANRALLDIWGYESLDELREVPLQRRFTPDSAARIAAIIAKHARGEHVGEYQHEVIAVRKDGQLRNIFGRRKSVVWGGRQCAQVLYEDITERKKAEDRLAEVSAHEEAILAAVPDIIMEMNDDGVYTWANRSGIDFFGDEVLGTSASAYLIGDPDTADVVEPDSQSMDGTVYFERWQRRKDGEKRRLAWWRRSLKDGQGRVIGTLSAAQDITERRAAEEALRESELRLSEAQTAGKIGHWEYDLSTDRIVWSDEIYRLYERDKTLGPLPVNEETARYSPEQLNKIKDLRKSVLTSGKAVQYDVEARQPSGEMAFFSATMRPLKDTGGRITRLFGTIQDITDRKKVEQELAAERENFRNSAETSPFGIQIMSLDGELVYANRTLLDMWSCLTFEELKSIPLEGRFTPESVAVVKARNEDRMNGGALSPYEVTILCKDGRKRDLRGTGKEVIWDGQRQIQVLYEDITERKHAETMERIRTGIFEAIASPASLSTILKRIVKTVEAEYAETMCSILTLDEDGKHLSVGAAPSLPGFYNEATRGMEIGDRRGSCGTAAYRNETVIVEDVLTHPYWAGASELAQRAGLRSCWSQPITSAGGCVLGTFAIYHRYPATPTQEHIGLIKYIADATSIAIERKRAEESLSKERENFRNSVESSPFGIQIIDLEGELVFSNRTMLDLWGFATFEEVKATPRELRFTPESVAVIAEHNRFLKSGQVPPPYGVTIVCRRDGNTRDLEAHSKEIIWNGQRCVQMLYQDITERRRAERALRQSEQKYRDIVDNAPLGIVVSSLDGDVSEVNKTLVEMHGYDSREEFMMSKVSDRYSDLRDRQNWIGVIKKNGRVEGYEVRNKRKDGSLFWTSLTSILRDAETSEQRLLTISRDITERKRAEDELALRASLLDAATDMILVTDANWSIMYANEASFPTLGYGRDEMVGRDLRDFLPPEVASALRAHAEGGARMLDIPPDGPFTVVAKGPSQSEAIIEATHIRKDGTRIPVEVHSRVVSLGDRTVWLDVVRDISERNRLRQQLLAQDRLASIGALVSGVAHEINNPLTSVIGFSQLLAERDLPYEVKEDIDIICTQAQRAEVIVRNLLIFAGGHAPVKQPSQINAIIEDVVRLRNYEQSVHNIQVVKHLDVDLPEVMADYFQLQQVFFNLVINAEHFMIEAHERGTLIITTERTGRLVRATVADDGPGIPPQNLAKVFDPFFTTKGVGKGTGLGLSICHGIVTEHHGRIYATNNSGRGATFVVELPLGD